MYPEHDDWEILFDCAAGYGLGGSTVAMFGRVGGGIYTKAETPGMTAQHHFSSFSLTAQHSIQPSLWMFLALFLASY